MLVIVRALEVERCGPALLFPLTALFLITLFWELGWVVEKARIVQLLVERVDYYGSAKTVRVRVQPAGIQSLSFEIENANTDQVGL